MIDIHCHILPGLDDGAFSIDESRLMAEDAFEHGTQGIVCTPHIGPYTTEELVTAFIELKEVLKAHHTLLFRQGFKIKILHLTYNLKSLLLIMVVEAYHLQAGTVYTGTAYQNIFGKVG